MININDKFSECGLHCEKVYPLEMMTGIQLSNELREDMSGYEYFHEVLGALPVDDAIKAQVTHESELEELFTDYGFLGFLGEFRKQVGGGGFFMIWAYGETYEEMAFNALKLATP